MSKQKNIWFDQDLPEKVAKCYPGDNDYEKYTKYVNFWKLEKSRCKDGFFLADGAVHIHPWLYFHTTYHKAEIDDSTGQIKGKIKATPKFRDIEWEIQDVERRCRKEQKGVSIFGSRGGGKTIWATSMSNWTTLFFKGQEVILSGGDVNTLAQLASYCETGLAELVPEFRRERYENKWSSEVRFGKRLPSGEKHPESWDSRFIIRNFDGGKKYDACNSRRSILHIFDEQGKLPNLIKCYEESKGCWSNDTGQYGLPLLLGTGGNFEKGQDAIEMFNNPDLYNLVAFDDVYENSGHKIGYFLSATKTRNEYKEEWSLYKYLKEKTKIKVTRHPDLLRIKILVSNEEKCMEEWVTPRRNAALESKNMNAIIAEKAKYPILPSECSLRLTGNDFPIEMLKQQKAHLIATGYRGTNVELYRNINTGGVEVNLVTEKKPIANFPIKESDDKTGCIVIYDFPEGKPPWGLHIAGIDPYKQDQAKYSSSLGACYIYRRTHDLYGTGLKDHIVAQYVGRPDDINEFNEQCLLLIEYYNALANSENEDAGFIQYVIQKEKKYLLAQGLDFLREMVPKTTIKRSYGLPGTEKPKSECRNVLINYCKEKIDNIFDDEGNITGAIYGVTRIYDLMLIEEMISYYKGGNFDRIIAASYGMAYARLYMDNHVGAIKEQADDVNMKMYNNFVSNTKKQSFFSSRKKLSFFNRK